MLSSSGSILWGRESRRRLAKAVPRSTRGSLGSPWLQKPFPDLNTKTHKHTRGMSSSGYPSKQTLLSKTDCWNRVSLCVFIKACTRGNQRRHGESLIDSTGPEKMEPSLNVQDFVWGLYIDHRVRSFWKLLFSLQCLLVWTRKEWSVCMQSPLLSLRLTPWVAAAF